jgi:hypothetical protein
MKILVVFIDMLRNDLIDSDKVFSKNLSMMLENIGGVRYNNCYTEAPDTPRSLATFWSGEPPRVNGCDTRLKYPYFFLKESSFLDTARSNNFKIHVFANPNKLKSGIIPLNFNEIETISGPSKGGISHFLKSINKQNNTSDFIFIDLSDLHFANDDLAHNYISEFKGIKELSKSLRTIEEYRNHMDIDKYLVFSDHGHQYDYERKRSKTVDLLDDNRTNVFLQIWQGEERLSIDNRLTTVSEFGKSVGKVISGEKKNVLPKCVRNIRIEDHENFGVSVGLPIKVFRHISDDNDVTIDFKGEVKVHRGVCDKHNVISNSPGLEDFILEYNILQKYKEMKRVISPYSNGNRRSFINKYPIIKYAYRIFIRLSEPIIFKNKS